MKILFVTYDIPYPLDTGGKIRAYHLIKQLSRGHQITLFSYYRKKSQLDYLPELKKYCQKICSFQRMPVFSFKHLTTTLLHPSLTAHIAHYYHPEIKIHLREEIGRGNYDLLHFESFFTSYLLNDWGLPQILGTENIEWRVFLEHAKKQKIPLLREAMIFESLRTRWFEEKTWRKANVCLAVSQENANEIEKVTGKKCYLIPNGIDLDYFEFNKITKQQDNKITILFVGNFKYIQNQDAATVLAKNIFPLIKKEIKNAKLLIVGRHPTKEIKNLNSKDILVDDQIKEIKEAYWQADLLLAPIRAGSGTKFKILEAMACGLPVITTPLGIEGIKAQDKKEVLIRESVDNLAKAAIQLINNKNLKIELIFEARKLVEREYSWEKIGKKLEKVYQTIR